MSRPAISEPPPARRGTRLREVVLPGALVLGDTVCAVGGLLAGYGMRYHTPIREWGLPVPGASLRIYLPLLLLGAAMLMATYAYLGLYDPRLLLRRVYSLSRIIRAMAFWLIAYLGLSLVLKFEPAISRLFVLVAFGTTLVITYLWRNAFYLFIRRPPWLGRVQQRVAFVGDDERAQILARDIDRNAAHPFVAIGFVGAPGCARDPRTTPEERWLGRFDQLEWIVRRHAIDVLIISTLDFPRDALARLMETCEGTYTEWKVMPSAFELFVSNLQLESHGGIPVLGVGPLPSRQLFNRLAKRGLDLVGASFGLLVALPVMAVAAWLVRRVSPGPVLFRQTRVGAQHRPFTIYKLRTMHPGAEAEDCARQSTTPGDPRVIPVGRLLRRWNIDELPQLWNVLRGEMSLVGPRPERPYHVDRLSDRIRHYLPRHLVKPGLTGWAQINGCRGACDLERRIQHDIYYIENWSLLLDLQILALTFLRWRAPE